MSESIDRRGFLKKSVIASAGVSIGLSFKEKAASAKESVVPALDASNNTLPMGRIGNVKFSRLIAGGNPFSATAPKKRFFRHFKCTKRTE